MSDTCCCCFSLKTGSILIGIFATLNFIGTMISALGVYNEIWMWFLPNMIAQGITAIHFFRMLGNLDSEADGRTRLDFAKIYLIAYLWVNMGWELIRSFQTGFLEPYCEVITDFPTSSQLDEDQCVYYLRQNYFWSTWIWSFILTCYFSSALRRFADSRHDTASETNMEPLVEYN